MSADVLLKMIRSMDMAMHDVEKTTIRTGYQNAKRMRRRRRLMPIYIFTVLLLTACLGISLSMTLFFNVSSINVTGTAPQYSAEEIAKVSGISKGDNLLRMNVKKLEDIIESDMIYVESATVSKKYPDSVMIDVKACRESYNIYFDNGILITSESGKIITNSTEAGKDLPVIYGFNPIVLTPGLHTSSSDETKNVIFETFTHVINEERSYPITSIDMSDKYNIVVVFDDRIEFSLGNWNEISYKITLAEAVIGRLGEGKKGYLTMVGNNQCSFREKAAVELANQISSASIVVTTADPESGNNVTETTTVTTIAANND